MKMTASLVVWPVSAISSLFTEILWKKYGMLFKKQLIFILKHAANEMKRRKSLIPARFHCAFLPIFTRVWRCRRMPLVKALISGLAAWATQFGLGNLFAAADRGVAGDRLPIACGFALAHPLTASSRSRSIWPAVLL